MTVMGMNKAYLSIPVVMMLVGGIAASALLASATMAAAVTGAAKLWAVPTHSRIHDGHYQLLKLEYKISGATQITRIVVTLDGDSTKRIEFRANGDIILKTDPFVTVVGNTKFVNDDGYSISKAWGKFTIVIDKTKLSAGKHTAHAEVETSTGNLSANAFFVLRNP
jgi:hypothetical protein